MDANQAPGTVDAAAAAALDTIWRLGGRRAAEDMSVMAGEDFFLSEVSFRQLPVEELSSLLGSPDELISTVLLEIRGDCRGEVLLLLPQRFSDELASILFAGCELTPDEAAANRSGALREAGNILGSAFLNSVSLLTGLEVLPTVPELAEDMLGAVLDIVQIKHAARENHLFLAESGIRRGAKPLDLYLIAIFERPSLELIVERLRDADERRTTEGAP